MKEHHRWNIINNITKERVVIAGWHLQSHLVADTTGTSRKGLLAINSHWGNVCPLPYGKTIEDTRILFRSPEQTSNTLIWRSWVFFSTMPCFNQKIPCTSSTSEIEFCIHQSFLMLLHLLSRSMLDIEMKIQRWRYRHESHMSENSAITKLESVFPHKHVRSVLRL